MQSVMNLKIKYRESFRPFAPAVLAEHVSDWFKIDRESPYMLLVANLQSNKCHSLSEAEQALFGIDKLNIPRSEVPAVTHVDYSARIQTVHAETNPKFHALLTRFYEQTKCPVLINTSFNVRGEPIVCTPEDAYRCFMRTEMDYLVLDNVLLSKRQQPVWNESENWRETFALD
jgi:carbamoyltransferase